MSSDTNNPEPLQWTPQLVDKFWDLFALSPLTMLSFAKQVSSELVNVVAAKIPNGGKILDFGAGDGDLAEALLRSGYSVAVYEPSGKRAETALKRLGKYSEFLGTVPPNSTKQFDIVCAFEVLEHILPNDVASTLSRIGRFLTSDGCFVGSVPRNENLLSRQCICPQCGIMFHRWQHMRSFTEETLASFLREGKFAEVRIEQAEFANSFLFYAQDYRK